VLWIFRAVKFLNFLFSTPNVTTRRDTKSRALSQSGSRNGESFCSLPPSSLPVYIKIIPHAKSLSGDTFFIANCVNLIEARSAKYRTNCTKFTIARFISHRFTIKFSPDTFPNNTFKWELSQTFNAEVYFEIRVIYLKQWKIY